MLKIPTVDDWFALTLKYREFQKVSNTVLKDYGYMAIMDYLDQSSAVNILEFGHGFNSTIFERYGASRNVWGVDDYQNLWYFPDTPDKWEKQFDEQVRSKAPECTYRRGLLGSSDIDLPENYFDVICSVSVLEEMSIESAAEIIRHSAKLLKPGGVLIGTHDILTDFKVRSAVSPVVSKTELLRCALSGLMGKDELPEIKIPEPDLPVRINQYVDAHLDAGLVLDAVAPCIESYSKILFENPTAVMIWYQGAHGEGRKYRGHWTTLFSVARKVS